MVALGRAKVSSSGGQGGPRAGGNASPAAAPPRRRGILHRIAHSPYLLLLSGLVLIGTSLAEILDTFEDPVVGVHHGILVLGITHLLQALPHLVHGSHELEEASAGLGGEPEE